MKTRPLKFRYKAYRILNSQLIVFIIFVVYGLYGIPAYAMSDAEIATMKNIVHELKAKAPQMSLKEKEEFLKKLDETFTTPLEREWGNVPNRFLELTKMLEEIVTALNLPKSQTKSFRYKIQVIKEWALATKKMMETLAPHGNKKHPFSSDSPRIITQFSGTGSCTTRPFTVSDGWEIQWSYKANNILGGIGIFSVDLYDDSGKLLDTVAMQQKSGEGSSYNPRGGKYYLKIDAIGDWKVKIIQLN